MKARFWMPVVLVSLLALGSTAQAQPPYPYGPGAYGPGSYPSARPALPGKEAADTLREGMDKLLAFLGQEEKPNKLQVAAFLDRDIAPYFDFDYMAKWVAGPAYSSMGEAQRKAMAANLEARFLSALAAELAKYEGQQVRYLRPRITRGGSASVGVGILRPGTYPSKIEFRMYKADDGWKVYDVVANGRSAAAFYRVQFERASSAGQAMPAQPVPRQPPPFAR
ncbi:MAG: ABC transporter substrate-binding protein [Chromatiaceae bacterium]|jgi:phospholipid transport system substrate-binding protein|nr:ABC transporter substrate-binding protein [Chromatiaceae bacterium]